VPDRITLEWLRTLSPNVRSLHEQYHPAEERRRSYERIVDAILDEVRKGRRVCAVFYGHPGVFVEPSHEAIRRVRADGLRARMLPGISAVDCLFADLGIDPGTRGCQSYEATYFLLRGVTFDPTAALVLWQIAAVGVKGHEADPRERRTSLVVERLRPAYGDEHAVILYEASPLPIADPIVEGFPLAALAEVDLAPVATLYVPPLPPRPVDQTMRERLGLS
jgi:hypothetical protein